MTTRIHPTRRSPLRRPRRQFRLEVERLSDRTLLSGFAFDPTFGQGGAITLGNGEVILGVQSDGKIVAESSTSAGFQLERFNPNGTLDSSFGTVGLTATTTANATTGMLEPDGKILVIAGRNPDALGQGGASLLFRFNSDGTADTTFGSGGAVTWLFTTFGGFLPEALAVQHDDKIVVAGSSFTARDTFGVGDSASTVVRLNADGSPDASFPETGNSIPVIRGAGGATGQRIGSASSVVVEPDGKIVVGGTPTYRINSDGTIDSSFKADLPYYASETAVPGAAENKVLLTQPNGPEAITRLNADGSLDTTYGTGGSSATNLVNATANGLALEPDGDAVLLGTTQSNPTGLILSEIRPDGTLDPAHVQNLGLGRGVSIVAQPDGNLLVSAMVPDASGTSHLVLYRILVSTVSPNTQFVTQLYYDLLHRLPDDGGLNVFSSALDSGTSTRAQVVLGFLQSQEYLSNQIDHAYLDYFGRVADPGGLSHWLSVLRAGATIEQVDVAILNSPEVIANVGSSDVQFLIVLYRDIFGRAVDSVGMAGYTHALASGVPRSVVTMEILTSMEARTKLVEADYETFLNRPADSGGLAYWLSALEHGATSEQVASGILSSSEYVTKT
jgi:uncharacterized delta-60 repeat protein